MEIFIDFFDIAYYFNSDWIHSWWSCDKYCIRSSHSISHSFFSYETWSACLPCQSIFNFNCSIIHSCKTRLVFDTSITAFLFFKILPLFSLWNYISHFRCWQKTVIKHSHDSHWGKQMWFLWLLCWCMPSRLYWSDGINYRNW